MVKELTMTVDAHHVRTQVWQQGTKALIFGFGFPRLFDYPLKQSKIKRPIGVTGVRAVDVIEFQHQAECYTHRFWHTLHLPEHQTQSSVSTSSKRHLQFSKRRKKKVVLSVK